MIEGIILGMLIMVVGGYGLGKICFERGYVHGVEDSTHKETITFVDEA